MNADARSSSFPHDDAIRAPRFGRFFLPGPTEVRPEVLQAMVRPMIGHRGSEMEELLAGMDPGLRELFQTSRPVYVSTSSATGLMEAAILNLSRVRVLCLAGGAFGERFLKIARRCGRPADALRVPWGEPHTPEQLRKALQKSRDVYDLVTVVHSETSTGVLNPVGELAAVVRETEDVLLAVDGVTSVGALRVPFDDWGLDFLLTGSQKALALPPGLALAAASERAVVRSREVPARSFYFDLAEFEQRAAEYQTTNTPAVPLLFALEYQLRAIAEEKLRNRWERHRLMAERTWKWVDETSAALGIPLRVLAPEGCRSPTVTAVALPEGWSGPAIARSLAGRGYTIAPGYGELREATIRIGHMGDHTLEELEGLLSALSETVAREVEARPRSGR